MKLIARLFALSLVVTGAVASTQIHVPSDHSLNGAKMSMLPVPSCPPNDPDGCGIGNTK